MRKMRIREFSPLYWMMIVASAGAMYLMTAVVLLLA